MFSIAYSASIGGMATLIGTPPNAIVFGSKYVTVPKMAKAGFPLNIIGTIIVTALTTIMTPWILEGEIMIGY
jgi:solute carrier family 13 (sodium-dependent dicarboxylate transporter), member 2/3/5